MLYPRKAAILYAVRGITLYCSADDFLCEIALSITKVVNFADFRKVSKFAVKEGFQCLPYWRLPCK